MQRCKDTKRAKRDGTKQARQACHHPGWKKGMHHANQHHEDVFSQMVTSKQAIRGTVTTKQVGGPKDQAQTHEGNKAMEKPRSSQTNMDIKHKSKRAYTCMKERIQTLCCRPRFMDVGLEHKI